ncbi:hypothetical protein [Streptomyces sp. PU-14G]|uniref:hypothetical protein n=1 Tax=Streptomyces sp. PU-14G TaxID=2800808 RepID=UPI0034E01D3E
MTAPHHGAAVWTMGGTGVLLSAVLPCLLLAVRDRPPLGGMARRLSPPPGAALSGFVLVHAAVTLAESFLQMGAVVSAALYAVLVAAGLAFWLPVLGPGRRLGDAGRCLYLFVGAPLLDIPVVATFARGHAAGGLAMIVGMLPVGIIAAALTWRWITAEERARQREETAPQPARARPAHVAEP